LVPLLRGVGAPVLEGREVKINGCFSLSLKPPLFIRGFRDAKVKQLVLQKK
jgi:hypothetical protein